MMDLRRLVPAAVLLISTAGCATTMDTAERLARGEEAVCQCCNCLIEAGTKPTDICPACTCGHVVTQCDIHARHGR